MPGAAYPADDYAACGKLSPHGVKLASDRAPAARARLCRDLRRDDALLGARPAPSALQGRVRAFQVRRRAPRRGLRGRSSGRGAPGRNRSGSLRASPRAPHRHRAHGRRQPRLRLRRRRVDSRDRPLRPGSRRLARLGRRPHVADRGVAGQPARGDAGDGDRVGDLRSPSRPGGRRPRRPRRAARRSSSGWPA